MCQGEQREERGSGPGWRRHAPWLIVLLGLLAGAWSGTGAPGAEMLAVFGRWRDGWFLMHLGLLWVWGLAWLRWGWSISPRSWRRLGALHLGGLLILVPAEFAAWAEWFDFRALGGTLHERFGITYGAASKGAGLRWRGTPDLKVTGFALPDIAKRLAVPAEPVAYRFETDRYGLRNVLDTGAREPSLLCLGDSLVVGGLVPIESTLAARLSAETGQLAMCVAEVAYGPQEEVLRLESTGLALRNRLVLQFAFEGNDLIDSKTWRKWISAGRDAPWPRAGFTKCLLALAQRPVAVAGSLRGGIFTHAAERQVTGGDLVGRREEVFFMYSGARIDRELGELPVVEEVYRACAQRVDAAGGRYCLVLIPHKLRVLEGLVEFPAGHKFADPGQGPSAFAPSLAEFCRDAGLPFLDLTGALREAAAAGTLPYFAKDTHLNQAGLALCARAVAAWLGETGLADFSQAPAAREE